jgi:cytochrome c oxidase subunit 3
MRREGADWRPLAPPAVLWANTAALVLASVFFQRASGAVKSGRAQELRRELLAGGAFTLVFLAGQLWAWREFAAAGYYLTANPANAFFYLLTALHGIHLLGGLWVWGTTLVRSLRGAEVGALRLSVELCTAYWHFLLAVWVALFGLLLFT